MPLSSVRLRNTYLRITGFLSQRPKREQGAQVRFLILAITIVKRDATKMVEVETTERIMQVKKNQD